MSKLSLSFFNCRTTFVWPISTWYCFFKLPCDQGFIQHHLAFTVAIAIAITGPEVFAGLLFGFAFFTVPLFLLLFCLGGVFCMCNSSVDFFTLTVLRTATTFIPPEALAILRTAGAIVFLSGAAAVLRDFFGGAIPLTITAHNSINN